MYLLRAFLDPTSRAVQADVTDPVRLHRVVMRLFADDVGGDARASLGVLHRLDRDRQGHVALLVQSRERPDPTRFAPRYLLDLSTDRELSEAGVVENPQLRVIDDERSAIQRGDRFHFRLAANTTKKVLTKSGPDGARNNGKRVPVRGDEERLAWLHRHALQAGFHPLDVRVTELAPRSGGRGNAHVTFAGGTFDGLLEVRDEGAFVAALAAGIGPAKAYGFGLLSIRRAR
jgi:CRISPR system Cascade subunit CasE